MPEPLLLTALIFFTTITVGTVLVAVHDVLEGLVGRARADRASGALRPSVMICSRQRAPRRGDIRRLLLPRAAGRRSLRRTTQPLLVEF